MPIDPPSVPIGDETRPTGRRAFLLGTGAAIAWTAPIITAVPAAAQASALTSPPFVASTNATGNSGSNSLTLARPSGTADGDTMLAIVAVSPGQTVNTPTGWSLLASPATSSGNPASARVTAYLFAYTGLSASTATTTFTRVQITNPWRAALATFTPAAGSSAVAVDADAVSANGPGATPPFPAVTITGALRTVVYLGATGTQNNARWTSTPGDDVALGTIGQGFDLAISYTLDVDTSPGVSTGSIAPGGSAMSTVTFTAALNNV